MNTRFHLIIIGDEILSGKRADKHMGSVIGMLAQRGLQLASCEYLADDPAAITAALRRAYERDTQGDGAEGGITFSCGGIGATPDDYTRACAAAAQGVPLALHPEAKRLIEERMQDMARENNHPYEPNRPDNVHRLNMGVFPQSADIIPNPYNKIPGFSVGRVHFVPGFPVMAHPMVAWVLDTLYPHLHQTVRGLELSVMLTGAMESTLTPLMEALEQTHAVKVFSLPSVDHPKYGRCIELGVKGEAAAAETAFEALKAALQPFVAQAATQLHEALRREV